MSEIIQVADLEKTKFHNTFHVEAVTGKVGGLAGGADIDFTTNAVTGQIQKTLPKILADIDWSYVGLFADGVTFTDKTDFAVDAVGTQWIYTGTLPFSATAGTVPSEPTYQAVHVKSASAISNANGGSVQDFIDAQSTTVAEIASGVFTVEGEILTVTDRAYSKFKLTFGGIPNGDDILDAGGGNTATRVFEIPSGSSGATSGDMYPPARSLRVGDTIPANTEALLIDGKVYRYYPVSSGLVDDIDTVNNLITIAGVESAITALYNTVGISSSLLNPKQSDIMEYPHYFLTRNAAQFPTTRLPVVTKNGNQSFTAKDLAKNMDYEANSSAVVKYVDWENGSDSNNGNSWATAYRSLWKPINVGGVDVVLARAGVYDRPSNSLLYTNNSVPQPDITTDITFIAVGGKVHSLVCDPAVWTLDTGTAYSAPVASMTGWAGTTFLHCSDVVGEDGLPLRLEFDTLANTRTMVGKYHFSGGTLTVNIGKMPTPYGVIIPRAQNRVEIFNCNASFFGFVFRGYNRIDASVTTDNDECVLVMDNCEISGSPSGNNLVTNGAYSYLFNCSGFNSTRDVFNYHSRIDGDLNSKPPFAYEETCIAGWAGDGSRSSDNCSTIHDGGQVLRINCNYSKSYGPVVADVNSGTTSLNYMVSAKHPLSDLSLRTSVPFANVTCKMWLDSCKAFSDGLVWASGDNAAGDFIAYRNMTTYNYQRTNKVVVEY